MAEHVIAVRDDRIGRSGGCFGRLDVLTVPIVPELGWVEGLPSRFCSSEG
jgi:hypothetical protein